MDGCAIDWSSDGFKNHTRWEIGISASPEPMINHMFCANAETLVLTRQLKNGGREPDIQ